MKYIRLLRVKHWIKNFLIFLPLVFNKDLMNFHQFMECVGGVLMFSGVSSIIYIFNDIQDVESDRQHPVKRKRPLASGAISISAAWSILVCVTILVLGGGYS